jgi:hypothetical protein
VSAAGFDRGLPSFFVAERRPIRLREGYLRYRLLDNAASSERRMNGDRYWSKFISSSESLGVFETLTLHAAVSLRLWMMWVPPPSGFFEGVLDW